MKELFTEKEFSVKHLEIIDRANSILEDYESQGYDLSLRQLYYQFVSKNWLENTERSYKNLGVIIGDARLAGMIDWDAIKDRGRINRTPASWDSPGQIIRAAAQGFCLDKWGNQPCYIEVMVEKQALEGVLIPVCEREQVTFTANKGYSSLSYMYEAGKRWAQKRDELKEVHIIYLGDHDPSGIDMTRDIQDRGCMFADTQEIQVHRVALNMDQVEELNPPENPAKLTDSRATSYIQRFGYSSWELDAIEPRRLDEIVTNMILQLRDDSQWEKDKKEEEKYRRELEAFAKKYKA